MFESKILELVGWYEVGISIIEIDTRVVLFQVPAKTFDHNVLKNI
jgi:hypothetical protein